MAKYKVTYKDGSVKYVQAPNAESARRQASHWDAAKKEQMGGGVRSTEDVTPQELPRATKEGKGPWKCRRCSFTSPSYDQIIAHAAAKHEGKPNSGNAGVGRPDAR